MGDWVWRGMEVSIGERGGGEKEREGNSAADGRPIEREHYVAYTITNNETPNSTNIFTSSS